ncbi:MAG: NAD(P)-binding domain-containing protein [Betaproteobacteria bacterium]|nr:NAD(P)-binding domain-containing protein [Betaproteobacteria bacterium]
MPTQSKPTVVVANWVHPEVRALLEQHARVICNETREPWPAQTLVEACQGAEALIGFMTETVDDAFLAACPSLKIVACALKGFDNYDVAACTRRGVWITIVTDLLTAPTAELTVGHLIALGRHMPAGDRLVRSGRFEGWRPTLYGTGLDGSTIGLIGGGAVGKAVARRLAGFRAQLLYWDKAPLSPDQEDALRLTATSLDELAARSDFVCVCIPLNAESFHLVGATFLSRMRPGALLVNTARGSVVDEEAVADALESGHLGGYAADVFEMEDWALQDRPRSVNARLLAMPDRTFFTPHLGSAVERIRRDIAMQAAMDVVEVLNGRRPPHAINQPAA